jgi:phosphoenolpyruvate synthase/pyruvate phosphate dikinase
MCEIPSNVILAKAFAERFDGFSIGSDVTLSVGRGSGDLAEDLTKRESGERLIAGALDLDQSFASKCL